MGGGREERYPEEKGALARQSGKVELGREQKQLLRQLLGGQIRALLAVAKAKTEISSFLF
jgi:hypothetical protein